MAVRDADAMQSLGSALSLQTLSAGAVEEFKAISRPAMTRFLKKQYGEAGLKLLRAYRGE